MHMSLEAVVENHQWLDLCFEDLINLCSSSWSWGGGYNSSQAKRVDMIRLLIKSNETLATWHESKRLLRRHGAHWLHPWSRHNPGQWTVDGSTHRKTFVDISFFTSVGCVNFDLCSTCYSMQWLISEFIMSRLDCCIAVLAGLPCQHTHTSQTYT